MRGLILCLAVFGAASASAQQPAIIDAALVTKIESGMVMPKGADPLSSYHRFYAVGDLGGRSVVQGVYLRSGVDYYRQHSTSVRGISGAFVMEKGQSLPGIADGGCHVLEMAFDLKSQTLVQYKVTDQPLPRGVAAPTAMCHGYG